MIKKFKVSDLDITNLEIPTSSIEQVFIEATNKVVGKTGISPKVQNIGIYGKALKKEKEILEDCQHIIKHYNLQGYTLFGYFSNMNIYGQWLYFIDHVGKIVIYHIWNEAARHTTIETLLKKQIMPICNNMLKDIHKKALELKILDFNKKEFKSLSDLIRDDFKITSINQIQDGFKITSTNKNSPKKILINLIKPTVEDATKNKETVVYLSFDVFVKENNIPINQGRWGFWPITATLIDQFHKIVEIQYQKIRKTILEERNISKDTKVMSLKNIKENVELIEKTIKQWKKEGKKKNVKKTKKVKK